MPSLSAGTKSASVLVLLSCGARNITNRYIVYEQTPSSVALLRLKIEHMPGEAEQEHLHLPASNEHISILRNVVYSYTGEKAGQTTLDLVRVACRLKPSYCQVTTGSTHLYNHQSWRNSTIRSSAKLCATRIRFTGGGHSRGRCRTLEPPPGAEAGTGSVRQTAQRAARAARGAAAGGRRRTCRA